MVIVLGLVSMYVQLGDSTGIGNGSTYLQKNSFNQLKHDVGSTYLQFELQHFLPEEGKLIVWSSHIVHGSYPSFWENKEDNSFRKWFYHAV